jgi:signal transduction histidine kinase
MHIRNDIGFHSIAVARVQMRKLAMLFPFALLTLCFAGCKQSNEKVTPSGPGRSENRISDSLNRLDSLVDQYRLINSEKALALARQAYHLAGADSMTPAGIKARLIMGKAFLNLRNDSSYFYLKSALTLSAASKTGTFDTPILFWLSKISLATFDYRQAVILLDSVVKLSSSEKNFEMLSVAFNEIGGIKDDLHDHGNAKIMFDTAYKIAARHSLYKQMGAALGNLARFETDQARSVKMQKHAVELLKRSAASENAIAQLYINIGTLLGDPDSAIDYYQAAIRTVDPLSSSDVVMVAYNNLAYGYADKKEYQSAENCLLIKAIPLAKKWGNLDWLATLNDTYADILIMEHRYQEASEAEKTAYQYRNDAYDFKVNGQVRLLSGLLDVKNKEIILNSKDQEIQRKTNRINLLTFLFVLFSGVSAFVVIWNTQRNRLAFERQRYSSAKKILGLEESFKGRLAMELHDMTSPIYTTLIRQIEEVNIPDNKIKDELYKSLDTLAEKIRRISHEMAGGYYENMAFDELVRGLCEEMQYRTNAQIDLFLDLNENRFPGESSQHILRMIQEILTNGVKYVKKGRISLSISLEFDNLNIIYHDDGPGFDIQTKIRNGLGLTNIFERAKLLGGKAFLESESDKGTHWRIRVPMN